MLKPKSTKKSIFKLRKSATRKATSNDELNCYLATPPVELADDVSPIRWWWEQQTDFPRLSRMALDHLTVLGELFFFVFLLHIANVCLPASYFG